ncbi:MAG: hypothetical protein WCK35_14405 [Chloroflexota bacterium]
MSTASEQKWPVEMILVQTSNSIIEEFNLYFLSGIANQDQLDTLKKRMPILAEFSIDDQKIAFSTLVNERQLRVVYDEFTRLAREWRGQYYSLTNKFVDVCGPVLEKKN